MATSLLAKLWGLLGRTSLAFNEGMLFPNAGAMHTWGMRTSIDVLWLKQLAETHQYEVIRIDGTVAPGQSRRCDAADTLLELAPGAVARLGTVPQTVRIEPVA